MVKLAQLSLQLIISLESRTYSSMDQSIFVHDFIFYLGSEHRMSKLSVGSVSFGWVYLEKWAIMSEFCSNITIEVKKFVHCHRVF